MFFDHPERLPVLPTGFAILSVHGRPPSASIGSVLFVPITIGALR
jgi:hypothetical protein